jgi:hypothetical protein
MLFFSKQKKRCKKKDASFKNLRFKLNIAPCPTLFDSAKFNYKLFSIAFSNFFYLKCPFLNLKYLKEYAKKISS